MLGTKIYKEYQTDENNNLTGVYFIDDEKYAKCAEWCNETQLATIEDKGDYYEVVEIPAPPLEELKTAKHNAAGAAFAAKRDAIRFIKISDGNTYGFDCANEDITNFFASWKAAEKVGETPYKVWLTETTKGMIIMPLADFDTVFDVVRNSQLEAYVWYNATAAAIEAATTKEELEAIVLE